MGLEVVDLYYGVLQVHRNLNKLQLRFQRVLYVLKVNLSVKVVDCQRGFGVVKLKFFVIHALLPHWQSILVTANQIDVKHRLIYTRLDSFQFQLLLITEAPDKFDTLENSE